MSGHTLTMINLSRPPLLFAASVQLNLSHNRKQILFSNFPSILCLYYIHPLSNISRSCRRSPKVVLWRDCHKPSSYQLELHPFFPIVKEIVYFRILFFRTWYLVLQI